MQLPHVAYYMVLFLQKKAYHFSLWRSKKSGFLCWGKSETQLAPASDCFTFCERMIKFIPASLCREVHACNHQRKERIICPSKKNLNPTGKASITDFSRKSPEQVMLSKSRCKCGGEWAYGIAHIHGDITPFLQQPQGKLRTILLKWPGKA